ncbi:MAG: 2-oxo acid dehydrogenase subunit E2 [Clostridia bacterium]|nr:2-oxo acid dehydrogenase subunit E2 [Clostridia bacterium]
MKKEKTEKKRKVKDIRRVKTLPPMSTIVPFIMQQRNESSNLMFDTVNVSKLEKYIKEKQADGMKNISMMHVLIAAYCRTVAQRPALNRFIRGQRVFTRRSIEVCLTIKKEMSLESPDTCLKIFVDPSVTTADVYEKLNHEITSYRDNPGGDFDNTAGFLSHIPSVILRGTIGFLKFLDYFRMFPKFLERVSPFHCSMFITSMGSLGVPAIYHHLYDFGTCPLFIAFGAKRRSYEVNPDGSIYKRQFMDVKLTCDERICDGYYYASAFKTFKAILADPWQLDSPPEKIEEDIR